VYRGHCGPAGGAGRAGVGVGRTGCQLLPAVVKSAVHQRRSMLFASLTRALTRARAPTLAAETQTLTTRTNDVDAANCVTIPSGPSRAGECLEEELVEIDAVGDCARTPSSSLCSQSASARCLQLMTTDGVALSGFSASTNNERTTPLNPDDARSRTSEKQWPPTSETTYNTLHLTAIGLFPCAS